MDFIITFFLCLPSRQFRLEIEITAPNYYFFRLFTLYISCQRCPALILLGKGVNMTVDFLARTLLASPPLKFLVLLGITFFSSRTLK